MRPSQPRSFLLKVQCLAIKQCEGAEFNICPNHFRDEALLANAMVLRTKFAKIVRKRKRILVINKENTKKPK